ncbi:DUF1289 domain-containing protein [Rouxiella chamberiensis]|uniref:DUF1289 domain-containing protein n=1 Tax=Rouxiella chamberiensis TaxID=1513468 RepID=A0ABY7HTL4_9GAMM|nr:DUF1289 domain-containing protein [Rouxiella chamberiensis]WAT02750.1 DUF1289 domain-containing protein [Rouxiella chamberiensis]
MAQQLEFFDIPVPSPCRNVCELGPRGYCRGCFRSRQERFDWNTMSNDEKRHVLHLCHQRLLRLRRAEKPADDPGPEQPSLF